MFTLLLYTSLLLPTNCNDDVTRTDYNNTWAVKLQPGANPDKVAQQLHMQNLGRIGRLHDYYIFKSNKYPRYRTTRSVEETEDIVNHEQVISADQQRVHRRVKRH